MGGIGTVISDLLTWIFGYQRFDLPGMRLWVPKWWRRTEREKLADELTRLLAASRPLALYLILPAGCLVERTTR